MKNCVKKLFALLLAMTFLTVPVAAQQVISVEIDGQAVVFAGQQPVSVRDITLVPLAELAEAMGYSVTPLEANETVILQGFGNTVLVPARSFDIIVNGRVHTMSELSPIFDGRMLIMVPLADFIEALGYDIWRGNGTYHISTVTLFPVAPMSPPATAIVRPAVPQIAPPLLTPPMPEPAVEADMAVFDVGDDLEWDSAPVRRNMPVLEELRDGQNPFAGEHYTAFGENTWMNPGYEPEISFSLQMDTASYRNIARMINSGHAPPPDAVRIAEMLNYFRFEQEIPTGETFGVSAEIGPSPFGGDRQLAFVRVRAMDVTRAELPGSNLTFLIDVSGSMEPQNRLPLLQRAFSMLVENLDANDTVSVVTYSNTVEIVLDSVPGNEYGRIMDAINGLRAEGGTAGGPGIQEAYRLAMQNFAPGMNNRIILATDGDFNVGTSTTQELEELMNEHRRRGIYMTILGVGMGNFRDDMLETIARNGNGNYHYIDTIEAARRVFIEDLIANMFVIAEEVRAQVAFNPQHVASYRLIGYENRLIENRHFDDDTRDAGEIGVGAEVALMFELDVSPEADASAELFEVRIRYIEPGERTSRLITRPIHNLASAGGGSNDFRFASAVAAFGHILRGSEYTGSATITDVLELAQRGLGDEADSRRWEFIELVTRFANL